MRAILASEHIEDVIPLRQIAHGHGLKTSTEDCVNFASLDVRLGLSPAPEIVFVFAGDDVEAALYAINQISARVTVPIIAVGPFDDLKTMQRMQNAARMYLDQARFREQLGPALDKLKREGAVEMNRGRIIAVTSATPGMGVTTVSTGIAFGLGEKYPQKTLLTELNVCIPELALNLGVKPNYPLQEILHRWENLDGAVVRQAVNAVNGGVDVLAHEGGMLRPIVPSTNAVQTLMRVLPTVYDFSIIDLGYAMTKPAQETITKADHVIIVSRVEKPSLIMTRKYIKQLIRERNIPLEKLVLVGNRTGQRRQLSIEDAQTIVEISIDGWIPDDAVSLIDSLNESQPLIQIAPKAKITRSFMDLASRVNGLPPASDE